MQRLEKFQVECSLKYYFKARVSWDYIKLYIKAYVC